MNKDKKVLYGMSLVIFATLLCLLLVKVENTRIATAILLLPLALVTRLSIRKRTSVSIYKREVVVLVSVIGAILVILSHMSGLYFGYYKNPYFVNVENLLQYVLPYTGIIVATELIRSTILAQKSKLADAICFLSCVLIEILMVSNFAGITSFYRFMDIVGLALLPAISANILYHYASRHYGMLPNIVYRIITTLYVYFIPTAPHIPDALMSCAKIILPCVLLALMISLYETNKKPVRRTGKLLGRITVVLTATVVLVVAMLISCQFRFGAIVIATESMTGEINKGDVIIYERYEGQPIKEGQVIVFLQEKSKIVHRVVEIDVVGGETHYYTKGDANDGRDAGYITEKDIFGVTQTKVAYVGYPTLWLRDFVKSKT